MGTMKVFVSVPEQQAEAAAYVAQISVFRADSNLPIHLLAATPVTALQLTLPGSQGKNTLPLLVEPAAHCCCRQCRFQRIWWMTRADCSTCILHSDEYWWIAGSW